MTASVDQLRDVNIRLRSFLNRISRLPLEDSAQNLTQLLGDLQGIGSQFEKGTIRPNDPQQIPIIREYRELLNELRHKLPVLQAQFLGERARLERERNHLQVAVQWTGAARHTTYFK